MAENEAKSHEGSMEKGSAGSTGSVHDDVIEAKEEIDFTLYHEHNAGRLVVDPEYVMFWRRNILPEFCD